MGVKIPPLVADLCAEADVKIGGDRPWDIQINNERTFARVIGVIVILDIINY